MASPFITGYYSYCGGSEPVCIEMKFDINLRLTMQGSKEQSELVEFLWIQTLNVTIESDTSNIGWEIDRAGDVSEEEASYHIIYLELLAAFLAL